MSLRLAFLPFTIAWHKEFIRSVGWRVHSRRESLTECGKQGTNFHNSTSPAVSHSAELYVLPLNSVRSMDAARVGLKAARLAQMMREGFRVPDGFVCTVEAGRRFYSGNNLSSDSPSEAFARAALPDAVVAALDDASGGRWAVRSSAVHEDATDASFAGLYRTILDVSGREDLHRAVRLCWAAITCPGLRKYRSERESSAEPQLALLIQRQLAARVAGAACSHDPLSDADGIVISAVRGVAAPLLAGACDGEDWIVGETCACLRSRGVLTAAEASAVAALVADVTKRLAAPQQVEWAFEGDRLYLLQTRPLPDRRPETVWRAPLPGAWLRNVRLGEWLGAPVTPLMASWLLPALERGASAFRRRWTGLSMPQPPSVRVHGWYFANVNSVPHKLSGIVLMMVRIAAHLARHPRRGTIVFMGALSDPAARLCLQEWDRHNGATVQAWLQGLAERLPQLDGKQQLLQLDRLVQHVAQGFGLLSGICSAAWNAELLLVEHCRRHLPPEFGAMAQRLLCGLSPPAPEPSMALTLDWAEPTAQELNLPHDSGMRAARIEAAAAERDRAAGRIFETLAANEPARKRFVRLLDRASRLAKNRSRCAREATRCWPLMRRALLALGAICVDTGSLEHVEDVFFLDRAELEACLDGHSPDLRAAVRERRTLHRRQRRLAPPLQLGSLPASFQRALAIAEVLREAPRSAGLMKGLPASPGRASGAVRIIHEAAELAELRQGEVLVAPLLVPAWVPLAVQASAAVVDTGNHLAHACMVAREIGLPCVVGVGHATTSLRTGEWITVDGSSGTVERVD